MTTRPRPKVAGRPAKSGPWSDVPPGRAADSWGQLRALFADLGRPVGDRPEDLTAAVRHFQAGVGLDPDGEAGPRTVHLLARYADQARDLRRLRDAAAA